MHDKAREEFDRQADKMLNVVLSWMVVAFVLACGVGLAVMLAWL